jgi:hypothetical protein
MSERRDTPATWSDDELEQHLRAIAAEVDPVPELLLEQARAAYTLRDLDAELAELVLDSDVDEGAALVRGGDDLRILSFRAEQLSVELEVSRTGGRWSLRGLAVGATGTVDVETSEGTVTAALDDRGRFTADDLAPGSLRLHLTAEGGARVTTSWVTR